MRTPRFRELLEAIRDVCDSALHGRPYMQIMRHWEKEVFSRSLDSELVEELERAWELFRKEARDQLGVDLICKEIEVVTVSCQGVKNARRADKKDVLNAAGTLMDSIKKDVKLPPVIEITWNAIREVVDVAKG